MISDSATQLLNTSRNGLATLELDPAKLQNMETELASLAVLSAEYAEYLGYRGAYGCGDHGHEAALKKAERRAKRVRAAIGFACP